MVGKQERWQKPEKFWSLLCQQHIRRKHAPGPENLTGYNMPQGSALFTNVFCYNFFVNSFINQQDFISLLHLSLNEFTLLSLSPSLPTYIFSSFFTFVSCTLYYPLYCIFSLGLHGHRFPSSFSVWTSFWSRHPLALHFPILTTSLDPLQLCCTKYSLLISPVFYFPLSFNENPMTYYFQCPNSHM